MQHGSKKPVCGHCRQAWPCHSWACWDGQLGEAVAAPHLSDPIAGRHEVVARVPDPAPVAAHRAGPAATAAAERRAA